MLITFVKYGENTNDYKRNKDIANESFVYRPKLRYNMQRGVLNLNAD